MFARQWIARFDGVSGSVADQLDAIRKAVRGTGEDFEVVGHLGADGLVLLRTPKGVAPEVARSLLLEHGMSDPAAFTPNAVLRASLLPNDPAFGELYGLHNTGQVIQGQGGFADADIDAPEAWDVSTGNRSVVAGVIDTGIDHTHPDLYRNIWVNQGEIPSSRRANLTDIDADGLITFADLNQPANQGPDKITDQNGNGYIDGADLLTPMSGSGGGWSDGIDGWDAGAWVDDLIGWDFLNNDNNPLDDNNHGTHCAGTIGGVGDNATGVAGVNWNVQLMGLKFLNAGGSGSVADAISCINYANTLRDGGVNVRVTSNSWGGAGFDANLESAIGGHAARGMVFVAAAGNSNYNNDASPYYPASFSPPAGVGGDSVVAVAATSNQDSRAEFSQWGLTGVDLAAPGVSVYSTTRNNGYAHFNGTSMATPHVAGAAALLWAVNPGATYQEVRGALLGTVDPVYDLRTTGPTPVATGGRLNLSRAVQRLGFLAEAVTPPTGGTVTAPPGGYVVSFTRDVNTDTLDPGDLTVDGVPATGVTYDTATRRATFTFVTNPVTVEGSHTIAIAGGAVASSTADALLAFGGQFRYDVASLAVTGTAPAVNSTIPIDAGAVVIRLNFNEPVDPATVAASDFTLSTGSVTSVAVVPGNQAVDVAVGNLTAEGSLTLTVASNAFADSIGNPNPVGFAAGYQLDYNSRAFPTAAALTPAGARVYAGTVPAGFVNAAADTDSFTLDLDAGQTATVVVRPTSTALQARVELFDPSNNSLGGPGTASAAGQPVAITRAITGQGTHLIAVSAAAGTGGYSVEVLLNAATEAEALSGTGNNTAAAAQSLDAALVTEATSLTAAPRTAVRGMTDAGPYTATAVAPTFTDISTTGTRSAAAVGDDATDTLSPSQLGGVAFTLFGTTYTSVSFNTNGLITFGGPAWDYENTDLSTSPALAAVAALWDDLFVDDTGTGTGARAVFWQVVGSGPGQQLVIQWNNVRQIGESAYFTFQAVLSPTGNVRINYAPSVTPAVVSSATVGVKAAGASNPARLLVSHNQSPGPLVGPNLSTLVTSTSVSSDFYSFTAAANDTVTVVLQNLVNGNADVQLLGPDGATVLATGTAGATNLAEAIQNFGAPAAGTYYVKVTGDGNVTYDLLVTRNAAFDAEGNGTPAAAQPVGASRNALGALADSDADWYSLTLPSGTTMFRAETRTPGDGPGQFPNALNPRIEVFDATGTLFLGGGVALADERNEVVTVHNLVAGGTYLIRLTGEGTTSGEYLLGVTPMTAAQQTGVLVNGTNAPSATYTASRVTSLVINFAAPVSAVDPGAFTLTRGATTLTSGAGGAISVIGLGSSTLTLRFTTAAGVQFGSLADGVWTLATDQSKVRNSNGVAGIGTNLAGPVRRLFGDGNGDGTVNLEDYELFGNAFGASDPRFDFNADGAVNLEDYEQFGNRFGTSL